MNILETAIRAAKTVDVHFVLERRPKLAEETLQFALYRDGSREAVYVFAQSRIQPGEAIPQWGKLSPEERSAWEISAPSAQILHRVECEERAAAAARMRAPRRPVPDWMRGDPEDRAPGMGDLVELRAPQPPQPRPLPIAPAPDEVPLPERKKVRREV